VLILFIHYSVTKERVYMGTKWGKGDGWEENKKNLQWQNYLPKIRNNNS